MGKIWLVLDQKYHFIAVSPDGYIASTDEYLEVKCIYFNPQSAKLLPKNIADAINRKLGNVCNYLHFDKDGNLKLKQSHEYYYQIQTQLNVGQKKSGYFAVYLYIPSTQPDKVIEDLVYLTIQRDERFWETKILPHLIDYYFGCMFPNLVNNRNSANLLKYNPEWKLCDETKKLFKSQLELNFCINNRIKWSLEKLNYVAKQRQTQIQNDDANTEE